MTVGIEGEIPPGTLEETNSALQIAEADQRINLLKRLGVDAEIADNLEFPKKIDLRPLRAPGDKQFGILFVSNGPQASCPLYLLEGSDEDPAKKPWHVVDQSILDCWHGAATLEIAPLRQSGVDDVMLHGVNEGHGSNLVADQTKVFSILDSKLSLTLATENYRQEEILPTGRIVEHQSTFLRFPGFVLEETSTSSVDEKLKTVKRRYWRWSEAKRKFTSGPFSPVFAGK